MSDETARQSTLSDAKAARIAGYLLVFMFFSLGATSNGLGITFHGTLTTSSPGELQFWLGHALLLFPGSLLIGYGFRSELGTLMRRAATIIRGLTPRHRVGVALALTALAVALARLGRAVFLLDLPVTDDEYAVDFGGRILASGDVMTRLRVPREALPDLFLHFRDGAVGSFDWLGGQVVAAIGRLTGLGSFVWTLVAVVPVPVLAMLMTRRLGPEWGGTAVVLFLCSPMALLLSMTTHAHLASRALLAVALLAFWMADRSGGFGRWTLAGGLLGLAFVCRPLEIAFFSVPIVVWTVIQAVRRAPAYRAALPGLVAGVLGPAAIFVWHAYAMTGNPWLPARFATSQTDVTAVSMWTRFGDNFTYNAFMLAIWFLGPLGLALVAAGVLTDRFTKLLGWCVLADLCLALFHNNPGLHIVGPIHYSECAVPLTIVATHGLANIVQAVRRHGLDARAVAAPIAAALVLGLGTFTAVQALALRGQAQVQRDIYDAIEDAVRDPGGGKAVVLAPHFLSIVDAVPALRQIGTWVHDWRRPEPDWSDNLLFLRDDWRAETSLRHYFPDRRFFRLHSDARRKLLVLTPLDGGEARPLTALGPTVE